VGREYSLGQRRSIATIKNLSNGSTLSVFSNHHHPMALFITGE